MSAHLRIRRYSGTGVQFMYDDKNCPGFIEPLADGAWRVVKAGKDPAHARRPRLQAPGPNIEDGIGGANSCARSTSASKQELPAAVRRWRWERSRCGKTSYDHSRSEPTRLFRHRRSADRSSHTARSRRRSPPAVPRPTSPSSAARIPMRCCARYAAGTAGGCQRKPSISSSKQFARSASRKSPSFVAIRIPPSPVPTAKSRTRTAQEKDHAHDEVRRLSLHRSR